MLSGYLLYLLQKNRTTRIKPQIAQGVNRCPTYGAGNPLFVGGDRGMPRYLIRFSRIGRIMVYLEVSFLPVVKFKRKRLLYAY